MKTKRPFAPTVMLHSFATLEDGTEEHCDFHEGNGYNVWFRRDFLDLEANSDAEPFDDDPSLEKNFKGLVSARHYARKLAAEFKCEIEEY